MVRFSSNEFDVGAAKAQVAGLGGKVRLDTDKGELTVFVPLDQRETEALTGCARTPEAKTKIQEIVTLLREAEKAFGGSGDTRWRRSLSPWA